MYEFCFIPGTMNHSAYDAEGRRKYLTRAEGEKFLKAAKQLPKDEAAFCLTIYYTGCRISEALSICGNDFDHEAGLIRFRSLKKRGKKEIRRVPLPEPLLSRLKKISAANELPDDKLWTFSRSTAWRLIKSTMQTAGISGIHATTKGLRHGFGVRSAMKKIPINMIRDWMGHSFSSTTEIYLDIRDEEERELIGRTW